MAATALEEKINKIRQKNEEIRRRHEEVEADKQNAAKLNALVKMVPPTDWPERKEPPEFSNPPNSRNNGNPKGKLNAREYRGQQQQYHAGGGDGKKIHVFAEGDGPPPDPSYNFLADSEREERTREETKDNDRFRGRGGPLRGSSRKRGGGREGSSKEYRGSFAGPKDASKPEYEAWRAERNRIDEARISRQRTAEGNWRREWDNNKINVEENETGPSKATRLDTGDIVRKDHKEFGKWQVDETLMPSNDQDSPRGRGGKQHVSRGGSRGSHNNRGYQHSNSYEQYHGPVSPSTIKPPSSPNGVDERTVVATDKSIKVIVNHGQNGPKGPVMSVKVSSSSIAGTGRVGPRQKPRVLYSSQSETEASSHEHEKYSSHKSPNDKTNRVYFNEEVEEQHRFVPKSPHPHRKSDGHPKSPYSPRKEFKYDTQQQKHGEFDMKLGYQQRREAKDSPKSPHLNRKTDFQNRESHIKQKNNNSEGDSFKTSHSQKRIFEKGKNDPQRLPAAKKNDDTSAPKPQRQKKRIDKSKNFSHNNSKESQESGAAQNSNQPNNLGTIPTEEFTKTEISSGSISHNEINNAETDRSKNNSGDSATVKITEEIQNLDGVEPKTNIEQKNIIPFIAATKIEDENVAQSDIESNSTSDLAADNSEPITMTCENVEPEVESEIKIVEAKSAADSVILDLDEVNKTSPEIASTLEEEIETRPIVENGTSDSIHESKNVQEAYDSEFKSEKLNPTPPANPDNLKKLENEPDIARNELLIEKTDGLSDPKPEKAADEIAEVKIDQQSERKDEISDKKPENIADKILDIKNDSQSEITHELAISKAKKVADEIPEVKIDQQSERKDEISEKKPEQVADEILQAEKIVKFTSVEEKVGLSIESGLENEDAKVENGNGDLVVKDSQSDKESLVI